MNYRKEASVVMMDASFLQSNGILHGMNAM